MHTIFIPFESANISVLTRVKALNTSHRVRNCEKHKIPRIPNCSEFRRFRLYTWTWDGSNSSQAANHTNWCKYIDKNMLRQSLISKCRSRVYYKFCHTSMTSIVFVGSPFFQVRYKNTCRTGNLFPGPGTKLRNHILLEIEHLEVLMNSLFAVSSLYQFFVALI